MGHRIETGAMHFKDDWTGFCMRGDDALFFASSVRALEQWLETVPPEMLETIPAGAFMRLRDLAVLVEHEVPDKDSPKRDCPKLSIVLVPPKTLQ